jgi:S-adenosyl methyltransferase
VISAEPRGPVGVTRRDAAISRGVPGSAEPSKIDTSVRHSARIWNYWAPDARIVYVDNDPLVLVHDRNIPDEEAYPIVGRVVEGLPSGSYLALYDGANVNAEFNDAQNAYNDSGAVPYHPRSPERIAQFFGGLELPEPGVVPTAQWRPDPSPFDPPDAAYTFGAVARKP